MSPKEKALELINKFDGYKDYAEYAVDEIIESKPTCESSDPFLGTTVYENTSYWEKVKQEINKL